jgi:thiol-disulfide isomerase/thioredoxin
MQRLNRALRLLFHLGTCGAMSCLVTAAAFPFPGWDKGAGAHRRIVAAAVETEETVVVYFQTDWCGWCRRLNQEYLADRTVAQYLLRLQKVAINPERGDDEASKRALADDLADM